ncbi:MAG: helix-turn-helix domain-containing protein [Gammaproteobacteria bacterium]|nr:helix-turn-helix domain-containing protein [Gammaproteobacteria bacterium]MDH3535229.1 helix-turn-helix domain-containing protein [Gammaproteobacteria bacterium]
MTNTVTSIARKRGRPPGSKNRASDGKNQSLTRALTLLERLSEASTGMHLTDLSYQLGMPAATVHRLLSTFEELDFVEQDEELGLWFIGLKAFTVGNAFLHRRDFVASARPHMHALVEQCGETVNLGVIDDGEVVFISQVESREVMRMIVRLGSRSPVHASGVGKALLASMSAQGVARILERRGLARYTDHTIVTPTRLHDELEQIRQQGYALDDEEHAVGLRCVAAPIFDENGQALAAISLSGPKARIVDSRLGELGNSIRQTVAEITRELGGRIPVNQD